MFLSIVLPSLFALVLIPGLFLRFGISRWQSSTLALRERLEAARARLPVKTFDPAELKGLPPPVQRYFEAALTPGLRFPRFFVFQGPGFMLPAFPPAEHLPSP